MEKNLYLFQAAAFISDSRFDLKAKCISCDRNNSMQYPVHYDNWKY